MERFYKVTRNVQLALTIFNTSNSGIVYTLKFFGLTCGTLSLYFVVALYSRMSVFNAFVFGVILVNSLTFYPVCWGDAFTIPVMMTQNRNLALKIAKRFDDESVSRYWRKNFLSIPALNFKSGPFMNIERNSTPLYLDFLIGSATNLLISYRV